MLDNRYVARHRFPGGYPVHQVASDPSFQALDGSGDVPDQGVEFGDDILAVDWGALALIGLRLLLLVFLPQARRDVQWHSRQVHLARPTILSGHDANGACREPTPRLRRINSKPPMAQPTQSTRHGEFPIAKPRSR